MNRIPTHVLLVEDDPDEARQIQAVLADDKERNFSVDWVRHLGDALARLARGGIDALLVDLMLPDAQGLAVFDQLFAVAPDSVILILSAAADEGMARQAVQGGANDYLVKGHVDAHWLPRALQYLLDTVGTERVMLGTDYPFPLGEQEPGAGIAALELDPAGQARLYHGTALEWLGLPASRFA